MPKVVLITGVSRFLGLHLASALVSDPSIDRVIGVDSVQPRRGDLQRLGRTEFVRADIRNPLIAKVLAQARVDTVVHTPLLGPSRRAAGNLITKELGLVGTMQLLAACQRSDTVRTFVLRSTTAVYGCGPRDPAIFTEDTQPAGFPAAGYAKEAVEVEGYVRGFMRRRPDIGVSVLRLTSLIGPTVDSPIARYLTMPLVPTPLGYDPRLQLLHEDDAVEVMRQATVDGHPGVFNVAGDGVITLAQAIRRAGRVRVPVPSRALTAVGTAVRNSGALELTAEHATFLSYGRAVDTTRLKTVFGYSPKYTSQTALASFIDAHPALPRLRIAALSFVDGLAGRVTERLADASGAHPVPPHSARSLQGARS